MSDEIKFWLTFLLGGGILATVVGIFVRIGEVRQWMRTTDKEVASHGSLLQQLESRLSNLAGQIKGFLAKIGGGGE